MAESDRAPSHTPWLGRRVEVEGVQRYARTLRERWPVVAACMLVTIAAAVAYVTLAPKKYQATSELLVTPVDPADPTTVGLGLITTSNDPGRDVATAASFVTMTQVGRGVIISLGLRRTELQVLRSVTAIPLANTSLVDITATGSSAAEAKRLADAFALQTVFQRTVRLHGEEDAEIASLGGLAGQLPGRPLPPGLAARLTTLQSLRAGGDPTISLASLSVPPTAPSSPRKLISIAGALFGGLILGLGVAFLLQNVDQRLRREEQLREIFRLPILARIPWERTSRRAGPLMPDRLTPMSSEAYRTLRATVTSTLRWPPAGKGPPRSGRSVMVTGASGSEGKSTTALNLAFALSHAGHRVILIETDLHRPVLARALGVGAPVGLLSVLSGQAALADALVTSLAYGSMLQMLLVERPEPEAADLLALPAAIELLYEAERIADYVVVDSPPLGEVTDTLTLAHEVDGLVIVAKLRSTRLGVLSELGELLAHNDTAPLGLVLVGVRRTGSTYYYTRPVTKGERAGAEEDDVGVVT